MRKFLLTAAAVMLAATWGNAQTARTATHMVPSGKGWGVQQPGAPGLAKTNRGASSSNGILYHGGPIMPGNVNVYFIWYGNWTNGPNASDSQTTVNLLNDLFAASGGIGGSGYEDINTTYYDKSHTVTGNVALAGSTTLSGKYNKSLSDSQVQGVVAGVIRGGKLPKDPNGIYFVLTSSDVNESSGFCTQYCGWHTNATILSADIKFAFVGNPDRCPSACEAQTISPNGDSGADGMANVMAHETEEAISDPDLNAWYDASGNENADKCAWKFGPLVGTLGNGAYNETFGSHNWLIQMNWENARGGGCDQTLGGTFYSH